MSAGLDRLKAETALKRAAYKAVHGTAEERSGRVISSALTNVRYNRGAHDLDVRFVTGKWYRYANVPTDIYQRLLRADSKGAFFNAYIRDNFQYREL